MVGINRKLALGVKWVSNPSIFTWNILTARPHKAMNFVLLPRKGVCLNCQAEQSAEQSGCELLELLVPFLLISPLLLFLSISVIIFRVHHYLIHLGP